MNVILAKSAGFCWGVSRAVTKARELAAERGVVYTDGPLIHNRQMMEQLREEGVVEIADPAQAGDMPLLIRAHGISPERRAALSSAAACLFDATCPDVARTQAQIRKYARRGYSIVIYGDEGHAEVIGLLGFAEGRGYVVSRADDATTLPELERICVVAQSTQFPEEYGDVAESLRLRFPTAERIVLKTICESTRNRQRELREMADSVDAIVVVGGSHSANTLRLVELARSLRPTYHIETADQLDAAAMRGYTCVGLTAGASTPVHIIEQVQHVLEQMG